MAKTNFTKVEEALNEGMLKMSITDIHNKAKNDKDNESKLASRRLLIASLQFEVKHCKDPKVFAAGGLSRSELKKMIQEGSSLSEEGWAQLTAFREKSETYKKKKLPEEENEKLVEAERKKHINKRYNTKEQWLPLH